MSKQQQTQKEVVFNKGVSPYSLTILFIIFGIIWISFSDLIIQQVSPDIVILSRLQTLKDSFFIIVAAVIIYKLNNDYLQNAHKTEMVSLAIQEERMRMLERLSGSIAHDINNPLLIIRGNSELIIELFAKQNSESEKLLKELQKIIDFSNTLKDYSPKNESELKSIYIKINTLRENAENIVNIFTLKKISSQELEMAAEAIITGCSRITNTVQRLSRITIENNVQEFDLKESILTAITLTRGHWIKVCSEIKLQYPEHSQIFIKGVESDFAHVFINLIINAVQAIEKTGQIEIVITPDYEKTIVIIEVTDNAHGIEPEILQKIGKESVSTKPVQNGAGLGLLRVTEIIRQNNGKISFQSELGKGTTVTIELPLKK